MTGETVWRTVHCPNNAACAEIGDLGAFIAVRSSETPHNFATLSRGEFRALLQAVKEGRFDDLDQH